MSISAPPPWPVKQAVLGRRPATLAGGIALIALTIYVALFPIETMDLHWWFLPWLQHIIDHGPLQSLAISMPVLLPNVNSAGNYSPPYFYLLIVGSLGYPTFDQLTIAKLVSVVGSLFCAGMVFRLLRDYVARDHALIAAAAMLLLPTVALNGAAWGQIDAYYSGFGILAATQALRGKFVTSMLAFGVALSFKLQAAFIGPFLLYMVISRRAPPWVLVLPPVAYALCMVPAWLAGRPALDLATIYLVQSRAYPWLSMNVPNPWALVQYFHLMSQPVGLVVGLALGGCAALAIAGLGFVRRLDGVELLLLALVSVSVLPFLLPKMADRYFFMADVLSYVLAVVTRRRWAIFVAIAIQLGSFGAYMTHLTEYRIGTAIGILAITSGVSMILWQFALLLRERAGGAAAPA